MTTNEPNVTPASTVAGENLQIKTDDVPFVLRLVVYGLGVAIVAMLGLIFYGFTVGFESEDGENTGGVGAAEVSHAVGEPITAARTMQASTLQVLQPAGFELASSSYANGALVMHFRKEAQSDKPAETRILILDLASGRVQTVELLSGAER